MKSYILAGAVLASITAWSQSAHAQWVVIDPAVLAKATLSEAHEAATVINTAQTVIQATSILNAAAHGNFMGITRLSPLLGSLDNSLGINISGSVGGDGGLSGVLGITTDDQKALVAIGQLTAETATVGGQLFGLVQQAKNITTTYIPPNANDFSALSMARQAQALAGQMATGQQSLGITGTRLASYPKLMSGAATAVDIKDAMDANVTVTGQVMSQVATTNQLAAAQILQRAQEANERNLEAQNWRKQTDDMYASAKAAEAAARAGTIQFITN